MRLKVTLSKRTVLAALIVVSVLTTLFGRGFAGRVRELVAVALAPPGEGAMYAVTSLRRRLGQIGDRGLSPAEHRELRGQRDQLAREANYWRALAEDYKKQARDATNFRGLFRPDADLRCELIPARVVALDALPYGQTVTVNARRGDGATPGALVTTRWIVNDRSTSLPGNLAVINSQSLVGCVTDEARAFTAKVRLITDGGFWIKARIRRRIDRDRPRTIRHLTEGAAEVLLTRANNKPVDGTAHGDGMGGMYIPDVPARHSIRAGDWVVTYPDGAYSLIELFIGRVAKVSPSAADQRRVTVYVKPAADLAALRDVFVVAPIRP